MGITTMQSKMLHRASLILALFVWFAENAAALQSLDRQQECSDQVACGFATATFGCNVGWVSARCPKTCDTCNAADSVCEDSDSRCDLLFEHPELTGPNFVQTMCGTEFEGERSDDICKKTCNTCS